ncbi:Uncharacterised protein [Vibrio cholerae]|nr:Uncharacterised protein [Vibrio cholerae]
MVAVTKAHNSATKISNTKLARLALKPRAEAKPRPIEIKVSQRDKPSANSVNPTTPTLSSKACSPVAR